jgi:hypothetical protein
VGGSSVVGAVTGCTSVKSPEEAALEIVNERNGAVVAASPQIVARVNETNNTVVVDENGAVIATIQPFEKVNIGTPKLLPEVGEGADQTEPISSNPPLVESTVMMDQNGDGTREPITVYIRPEDVTSEAETEETAMAESLGTGETLQGSGPRQACTSKDTILYIKNSDGSYTPHNIPANTPIEIIAENYPIDPDGDGTKSNFVRVSPFNEPAQFIKDTAVADDPCPKPTEANTQPTTVVVENPQPHSSQSPETSFASADRDKIKGTKVLREGKEVSSEDFSILYSSLSPKNQIKIAQVLNIAYPTWEDIEEVNRILDKTSSGFRIYPNGIPPDDINKALLGDKHSKETIVEILKLRRNGGVNAQNNQNFISNIQKEEITEKQVPEERFVFFENWDPNIIPWDNKSMAKVWGEYQIAEESLKKILGDDNGKNKDKKIFFVRKKPASTDSTDTNSSSYYNGFLYWGKNIIIIIQDGHEKEISHELAHKYCFPEGQQWHNIANAVQVLATGTTSSWLEGNGAISQWVRWEIKHPGFFKYLQNWYSHQSETLSNKEIIEALDLQFPGFADFYHSLPYPNR